MQACPPPPFSPLEGRHSSRGYAEHRHPPPAPAEPSPAGPSAPPRATPPGLPPPPPSPVPPPPCLPARPVAAAAGASAPPAPGMRRTAGCRLLAGAGGRRAGRWAPAAAAAADVRLGCGAARPAERRGPAGGRGEPPGSRRGAGAEPPELSGVLKTPELSGVLKTPRPPELFGALKDPASAKLSRVLKGPEHQGLTRVLKNPGPPVLSRVLKPPKYRRAAEPHQCLGQERSGARRRLPAAWPGLGTSGRPSRDFICGKPPCCSGESFSLGKQILHARLPSAARLWGQKLRACGPCFANDFMTLHCLQFAFAFGTLKAVPFLHLFPISVCLFHL